MKVAIITMLIFVMFLSIIFVGNSYGQTKETATNYTDDAADETNLGAVEKQISQKNTIVFMQMYAHDSNGQMIGYTEGQPQIFYLDDLIKWVEPRSHKTIIKQGEKSFELMQYQDKVSVNKIQTSGAYFFMQPIDGDMKTLVYFHFDSFHLFPGDTTTILWTVTRSVN